MVRRRTVASAVYREELVGKPNYAGTPSGASGGQRGPMGETAGARALETRRRTEQAFSRRVWR